MLSNIPLCFLSFAFASTCFIFSHLSQTCSLVFAFPLVLQSIGLLSSMVGVLSMRGMSKLRPEKAFNAGMAVAAVLATAGSFLAAQFLVRDLTLFVTTSGYVAARLDPEAVRRMALRQPPGRAAERLEAALPLAEPPEIVVRPEWFPLLPVLPLHITVHVVPGE